MALLFVDSFDHYATADLLEKWGTASGSNIALASGTGRRSSNSLRFSTGSLSGNATLYTQRAVTPADATAVIGVAVKLSAITYVGTAGTALLSIRDGATAQLTLRLNNTGTLSAVRGTNAGTVLGTTTATVAIGASFYLECKVLIHPSAGTVEVRINGTSVLSLTGQNTQNTATSNWTAFALLQLDVVSATFVSASQFLDFDDLYVCDGSGPAPWNTFLGDIRVDVRYPTAEGAASQWTPSSGTDNALLLDETAPNDDTDYVSTATVSQKDTFVVQDAPVVGASILGVQVNLAAKKSDAGACSLAPVIRHSGTDYQGTDKSPGTAYSYLVQTYGANPGTSAQWTEADFNACEVGYIRTA